MDKELERLLARVALEALEARGFRTDFTPEEMAEVGRRTVGGDDPSIRDLRGLAWMSADSRSTLNPEQVAVAERLPAGKIRVRVAVSDLDAAVPRGSALDRRAHHNGQAIYGPGGNFPMLPWKLLNEETAFVKDGDRLGVVAEFVVDSNGRVGHFDCYRARVKNHGQLSYDKLADWLQSGFPESPTGVQMELQAEASGRLAAHRERHELVGLSDGVHPAEELVEELMKTSNEVAAQFLQRRGFPIIFQTIGPPERWDRILTLAERQDYGLPEQPDAEALVGFLKTQKRRLDPESYGELALSVEKLMGRTSYAVKEAGHPFPQDFQLSDHASTRSTSPSRDYAALTVQRLLKAAIAGEPPPVMAELEEVARHCNERREDAYKVKRQVYKSKDASRLAFEIGHTYKATVTGSAAKGIWVRLAGKPVEGRVVGGGFGMDIDVGDQVMVRLVAVDPPKGHIDFELL